MKMDRNLKDSYSFCCALARREARNFYYAFLLLPRVKRQSMCALYAFLRRTDDLADLPATAEEKSRALVLWRRELDQALTGMATGWPGFLALADAVSRHGIPPELLREAIDGVSMDVEPRPLASFDDLAVYCYHVASVVGLCCLRIWGYRSENGTAERLAERCGIALQLTNIIRDVHDDACTGRIYLPQDDMARFSVKPDDLSAGGPPSQHVRDLLAFEKDRALEYYDSVRELAPLVDPVGRPVLLTIVGIYRALLDQIVKRDYDVFSTRVSLSPLRKTAIMLAGLAGRLGRRAALLATASPAERALRAEDWTSTL
jgi:15-cis-phytoene synthase